VFAHCSFNLYHHPGVLGCRRSSPANERARVEQVRDALVAAREAARASRIESRTHEARHTSHTPYTHLTSASKHEESLLEHAANVTARATSTLPRLAARAACEAVSFSLERRVEEKRFPNVADAGASAAARALETALEALRSPELRSSLAFLNADDVCARAFFENERDEKTQALLDDARAFAALARNDASDADKREFI